MESHISAVEFHHMYYVYRHANELPSSLITRNSAIAYRPHDSRLVGLDSLD